MGWKRSGSWCARHGALERLFGKNGRVMYMRACGLDDSPIQQHAPVKSVSNEVTFANDLRMREDIEAAICTQAAR